MDKLAEYGKLDLEQTFAERQKRNMRGPTMQELDQVLVRTEDWEQQKEMFPCRSGVFMCYPKWGEKFGKKLEWEGRTVLIPKRFQGRKGIALVAMDSDVQVDGKTYSSSKLEAFRLPYEDGWYDIDKKWGLPIGKQKDCSESRRKLYRYQGEAYVGLVVRGYDWLGDYDRCLVDCVLRPDYRFGVHGISTKGKSSEKQPDLRQLAQAAEPSVRKLDGVIEPKLLDPLKALVEAAKR